MTSDAAIRSALERRATYFEPPPPTGIEHIVGSGSRRQRRSRLNGALVTLIVAVLVSVGVGSVLRDSPDDSVFATQTTEDAFADENLELVHVVFDGERYVGLASDGDYQPDWAGHASLAVATSADGDSWQRVVGSPIFTGNGVTLAEHGGRYVVVLTRAVAPSQAPASEVTQELVMATSDDLVEWREQREPLPAELVAQGETLRPVSVVVANAGVLIETQSVPAGLLDLDEQLEALGYDIDNLCDFVWESSTARFRECGTAEKIRVYLDTEFARSVPFEQHLFFAGTDGPLAEIQPPTEDYWRPRAGRPLIYATATGFGLQGPDNYESDDAQEWTLVQTRGEQGAMIAARGPDRVFRSSFPVARFGPDDPLWGMAFRSDEGEWEEIDLGVLYGAQPDAPRWFSGLQSGPAGWTMIAQRSPMSRPDVLGVYRDRTGASDFTMTSTSGHVLTGSYPFGPATLVDAEGTALQSWQQLEVENPEWSGLRIDRSGVSVLDNVTGEAIVTFTLRQWSALVEPLGLLEYDLLFSADGRNWEMLETYLTLPRVLAIGDDELVVLSRYSLHYVFSDSEVRVVPLDSRD